MFLDVQMVIDAADEAFQEIEMVRRPHPQYKTTPTIFAAAK